MFGLGLQELIILVIIIGIPTGIIAFTRVLRKSRLKNKEISNIAGPNSAENYAYIDQTVLSKFVKTMLLISLGVAGLSLLSDIMQINLLSAGSFSRIDAESNDTRQRIIALIQLATFVVTGIALLKWICRANSNCHGLGAQGMKFTPGWSIGYYFVPFLNLVRPYQSMKEIYQVSRDPANWQTQLGSPLLGWWWTFWLTSSILGRFLLNRSIKSNTIDSLWNYTIMSIASSLIDIALCIITISLVKAIHMQQERLAAKIA